MNIEIMAADKDWAEIHSDGWALRKMKSNGE